jgi:hypothetical protein
MRAEKVAGRHDSEYKKGDLVSHISDGQPSMKTRFTVTILLLLLVNNEARPADSDPSTIDVGGQPLAANVTRLLETLDVLGAPLFPELTTQLRATCRERDAEALQRVLDRQVLIHVSINPESRVKVRRGLAAAHLQQAGFVPVLVRNGARIRPALT